jgi:hypothetical protein
VDGGTEGNAIKEYNNLYSIVVPVVVDYLSIFTWFSSFFLSFIFGGAIIIKIIPSNIRADTVTGHSHTRHV